MVLMLFLRQSCRPIPTLSAAQTENSTKVPALNHLQYMKNTKQKFLVARRTTEISEPILYMSLAILAVLFCPFALMR